MTTHRHLLSAEVLGRLTGGVDAGILQIHLILSGKGNDVPNRDIVCPNPEPRPPDFRLAPGLGRSARNVHLRAVDVHRLVIAVSRSTEFFPKGSGKAFSGDAAMQRDGAAGRSAQGREPTAASAPLPQDGASGSSHVCRTADSDTWRPANTRNREAVWV